VFAGPLNEVTHLLADKAFPLVGISWGFDLQQGHANAVSLDKLHWLDSLDGLIVDSRSSIKILSQIEVESPPTFVIPWGVNLQQFKANGDKHEFGFPEGSRVCISLRQMSPLYRTSDIVESFIKAAAENAQLCLVMGNEGPLRLDHEHSIRDHGLWERVRFTGQLSERELPAILRSADLYISASQTDGTSVTLLQAMACCTPVLVSEIPGNADWVVPGRTGRLFPTGDISAITRLLAQNDASLSVMAQRAHKSVTERANWQVNRLKLREIALTAVAFKEDRGAR